MSRRLVLSLAPLAVASVCALAWWLAGPDLELRVAVSLPVLFVAAGFLV